MLLKPIGFLKAAGGGGAWEPTDLGSKLILWWDFTVDTDLFSDSPPTTNVTDTGEIVYVQDKSSQGNDGEAGISSDVFDFPDGPTWSSSGFATYDGAGNRLLCVSPSGLTSDMAVFALLSTTDTPGILLGTQNDNAFLGVIQDANGTAPDDNAGSPSYEADGTAVATSTRDGLHTEWATGSDVVAAAFGADLTTDLNWGTSIAPMSYTLPPSFFGIRYPDK